MHFNWPDTPALSDGPHVLADYAELMCWRNQGTSKQELISDMGQLAENCYEDGVPEEEEFHPTLDSVFEEIDRRQEYCGGGYPFSIGGSGHVLYPKEDSQLQYICYKFMLLATRLNMNEHRYYGEVDRVAANAVREYFGSGSKVLVFGARQGQANFAERVSALCKELGEGGGASDMDPSILRQRDGKLDVVVWKPFADRMEGKLIAFGQCKSGSSYLGNDLYPQSFCDKWMQLPLSVAPIRLFLVAEALERTRWATQSIDNGLQFDRCRIVEHCRDICSDVLAEVSCWMQSAADECGLSSL